MSLILLKIRWSLLSLKSEKACPDEWDRGHVQASEKCAVCRSSVRLFSVRYMVLQPGITHRHKKHLTGFNCHDQKTHGSTTNMMGNSSPSTRSLAFARSVATTANTFSPYTSWWLVRTRKYWLRSSASAIKRTKKTELPLSLLTQIFQKN